MPLPLNYYYYVGKEKQFDSLFSVWESSISLASKKRGAEEKKPNKFYSSVVVCVNRPSLWHRRPSSRPRRRRPWKRWRPASAPAWTGAWPRRSRRRSAATWPPWCRRRSSAATRRASARRTCGRSARTSGPTRRRTCSTAASPYSYPTRNRWKTY